MYLSMLGFDLDAATSPSDDDVSGATRLVSRIPGVRMAISGPLRRVRRAEPERSRAALLLFDDLAVAERLARGAEEPSLFEGTGISPSSLQVESIEANVEIALEPRHAGQRVFTLAVSFDYGAGPGDAAAAERHYLEYHVKHSRLLPHVRAYFTGKVVRAAATATAAPPRARMGVEIFDNRDMMAESFRSPVGELMQKDGAYVCANVRIHHLDGMVIL